MNKFLYLLFFVTLTMLSSCSSLSVNVPLGKITTDGVTIRAEDGTFNLKSGDIWTPPFQNNLSSELNSKKDLTNFHSKAMELGAKKVRVKVPYQSEELYGILYLSQVSDKCSSATTRSYQITIPNNFVIAAKNGRVSVLYEYYSCGRKQPKTWILWLSDMPFR